LDIFGNYNMLIPFDKVAEIQQYISKNRLQNKTIGFVPTMGALHKGHISLIQRSNEENDITIVSIFVNPTQFNDQGDFKRYPRTIEKDKSLLEEAGCDCVFIPSVEEIYPSESFKKTEFSEGSLGARLEGKYRPGHFNGVATVVKRLFEIVTPDRAYFGQKDYQQCLIIKKLVKDLKIPVEIVMCPILREENGLAMSSRNQLLSAEEREQAAFLYNLLQAAAMKIKGGNRDADAIKEWAMTEFSKNRNFEADYFDICSENDLSQVPRLEEGMKIVICTAAFLGKVRLIDNIIIEI
jgi:pantoate--beta-alanine ligase